MKNLQQAAELLGISKQRLSILVQQGRVKPPPERIGKRNLVFADTVEIKPPKKKNKKVC